MKAIVVTGGTRGIGFEIARLFATRPMNAEAVVLTGTDPARLADAAAAIQAEILDQRISNVSRVIPVLSDLSRAQAYDAFFDTLAALDVEVEMLVNNAGFTAPGPIETVTDDDFARTLQVNLISPVLLVREAMRRGHGLRIVVNIASTAGMNGRANWITYSASKAGMIAASEAMRDELAGKGIDVVLLSPGRCATDLRRTLAPDEDPSTIMQPAEVASALHFLCSNAGAVLRKQNLVLRR